MRDSRRIPLILGAIAQYWEQHPDQRFFQVVESLKYMLPEESVSVFEKVEERFKGQVVKTSSVRDSYYVEDDILLDTLMLVLVEASDA